MTDICPPLLGGIYRGYTLSTQRVYLRHQIHIGRTYKVKGESSNKTTGDRSPDRLHQMVLKLQFFLLRTYHDFK